MREPDAVATVTLLPIGRGGRACPTPPAWFGCVATTPGGNFDIRMKLDGPLVPGMTRQVPLYFLAPWLAAPFMARGAQFGLWEGGEIGIGHIDQLYCVAAAE